MIDELIEIQKLEMIMQILERKPKAAAQKLQEIIAAKEKVVEEFEKYATT